MARVSLKITITGTIDETAIDENADLGGTLIDYINGLFEDGSVVVSSSSVDYDQTPLPEESA